MRARRYTGPNRRPFEWRCSECHDRLRPAVLIIVGVFMLPILIGLGARWSARTEIKQVLTANGRLEENGSYRAATGELTTQIQSLESVINDLGARAALDPAQARAMQKLPAVVKARAAGGTTQPAAAGMNVLSDAPISSPEDTFGVLRDSCSRRSRVAFATCAATSSGRRSWPPRRRRSGRPTAGSPDSFGGPKRSVHRRAGFHQGIDISADKGQPVYATADGDVESASYTGDYGNLIVLRHDFGLTTRYGHLSEFVVSRGRRSSAATSSATSARPAARPARISTTKSSPTAS